MDFCPTFAIEVDEAHNPQHQSTQRWHMVLRSDQSLFGIFCTEIPKLVRCACSCSCCFVMSGPAYACDLEASVKMGFVCIPFSKCQFLFVGCQLSIPNLAVSCLFPTSMFVTHPSWSVVIVQLYLCMHIPSSCTWRFQLMKINPDMCGRGGRLPFSRMIQLQ